MEIKLPPDFKEFLKLLKDHAVEYLLIGGYAVGYFGYPRATHDLDVWISSTPENAAKVVSALREFGFNTPDLNPDLFLAGNNIVRMGVPPLRIEVLTTISGVRFEECYPQRVQGVIDGELVSVISLEHLKKNKKASGRHKDLNDLQFLP
ncbi:MAG: nucleotidyltransferase domain-containing protein [Desulfococcaceae bacterium]